jgi:hypothetical protein
LVHLESMDCNARERGRKEGRKAVGSRDKLLREVGTRFATCLSLVVSV